MSSRFTKRLACLLAIALTSTLGLNAQELPNEEQSLVQIEPSVRRLPADNVALFNALDRELTIKLQVFDQSIADSIADTFVTVIDPEKKSQVLVADADGEVKISDVSEGVYIVSATNSKAHGTIVIACRSILVDDKDKEVNDIFSLDFEKTPEVAPVPLVMMCVREEMLQPIVTNNLPEEIALSRDVIDSQLVEQGLNGAGHEFIIQLGEDGALRGRLISVVKPTSRLSGLQGTVVVVFKDGEPVGKTIANALGQFQINGLKAGSHGLVVAGRGGYTAFGMKTVENDGLLRRSDGSRGFAYSQLMNDGEVFPVVLTPPTHSPGIVDSIASSYAQEAARRDAAAVMLAQTPAPEKEDLAVLEEIRESVAAESDTIETVETASIVEVVQDKVNAKSEPTTQSEINRPRRTVPVNPLRLVSERGDRAPFNPLRDSLSQ
ncbi:MAG: hypothetical protein WBD20_11535 [Pirellulaceae bacterium]